MKAQRELILQLAQFAVSCQESDHTDFLERLRLLTNKIGGSENETRNNGRILHVDFSNLHANRMRLNKGVAS